MLFQKFEQLYASDIHGDWWYIQMIGCPGSQFTPRWAGPYRSVIVEQLGHSEIIQCTLLITKQLLHFSTHPEDQPVEPSLQIGVEWNGAATLHLDDILANKNLNPSHLNVAMQHLCYKQRSDSLSKRSLCKSYFPITLSSTNSLGKDDLIARVTYLKVKLLLGSSSSALSKSDRAPCRSPSFRFTSPRTLQKKF